MVAAAASVKESLFREAPCGLINTTISTSWVYDGAQHEVAACRGASVKASDVQHRTTAAANGVRERDRDPLHTVLEHIAPT